MSDTSPRGRFVWYELQTSDPDAAKSFYPEVAGWSTAPFEDAPMPYTMWMNGESAVGGVMQLPEEAKKNGAPPHWLVYIGTPDVDATVEKAKGLGATVLWGPETMGGVGRWAVLRDPQGAVFAAFTPGGDSQPAADHDPEVGEFSWHELYTTDHEKGLQFYSELFGWEKTEAMDMGEMGVYQMYGRNGRTLGGMMNLTPDMKMPPAWLIYARVPDADRAAEKAGKAGGKVVNGPMEVPGGDRIAQIMDPQGAMFAVHSKKA